jgi:putative two-component system response regulator
MRPHEREDVHIVVVDDNEANTALLRAMLVNAGYATVTTTQRGADVRPICEATRPDLLLLDLHMPERSGIEVLGEIADLLEDPEHLPVLVLTADTSPAARREVLAAGARDYVTKPFDRVEVLLRVRRLLETRRLERALREHNATLADAVRERTEQLEQARLETLERLALAAEYRDDDTHEHALRIGRNAALLAAALGLPPEQVELLRRAAPLHDVGKIGIPDAILLKPARLTHDEMAVMRTHTTIGAQMLGGSRSRVLRAASEIALSHHEAWDGRGYPEGRAGDEIPLLARVVAVVDTFDALTHERPYKRAWSVEDALEEVLSLAGSRFAPAIVEAFAGLDHRALVAPTAGGYVEFAGGGGMNGASADAFARHPRGVAT